LITDQRAFGEAGAGAAWAPPEWRAAATSHLVGSLALGSRMATAARAGALEGAGEASPKGSFHPGERGRGSLLLVVVLGAGALTGAGARRDALGAGESANGSFQVPEEAGAAARAGSRLGGGAAVRRGAGAGALSAKGSRS
jgi:hypothetical protein